MILLPPGFLLQKGPQMLVHLLLPYPYTNLPQILRLSMVSVANLAPSILDAYNLDE